MDVTNNFSDIRLDVQPAFNYTRLDVHANSDNTSLDLQPESFLETLYLYYSVCHTYISIVLCVFGLIGNTINVFILSRINMACSASITLTGMAVCDGLVMALYIVLTMLRMFTTLKKAVVVSAATITATNIILYSISRWLTVTLAIFRFIAIRLPLRQAEYCSRKRTLFTSAAIVAVCIVLHIPSIVPLRLCSYEAIVAQDDDNVTGVVETKWYIELDEKNMKGVIDAGYWMYAILMRFLPIVLLIIFSVLLVVVIRAAKKHRRTFLNNRSSENEDKQLQRTTRILILIVLFSVISDTPHGILLVLSGIIPNFFENVYLYLGDVLDLLALINCSVNFILYCSMCQQYRTVLVNIYKKCRMQGRYIVDRANQTDLVSS